MKSLSLAIVFIAIFSLRVSSLDNGVKSEDKVRNQYGDNRMKNLALTRKDTFEHGDLSIDETDTHTDKAVSEEDRIQETNSIQELQLQNTDDNNGHYRRMANLVMKRKDALAWEKEMKERQDFGNSRRWSQILADADAVAVADEWRINGKQAV